MLQIRGSVNRPQSILKSHRGVAELVVACELVASKVVLAFERVMTTVSAEGEAMNAEELNAVLKKVRVGVADGGASAQKCLQFLAVAQMPNMLLIGRDPAHALRIATKQSLVSEERFGAWWDDVFDARHALVPDINNSEEWKEKLLLCQRQVLGSSGVQGGDMKTVIRSISFAKQRFDSCATPQRQYCCLQVAIAMLLAYIASDARQTVVARCRARRRLQEMPHNVLTAGLSASYSEECLRFIRRFDVHDHDPALTWGHKHEFAKRAKHLFLEGHIFHEASEGTTCLQIALKTAQEAGPIYYDDGQVVRLWCKPAHREMLLMSNSVQAVVEAMLARVDVELPLAHLGVKFTAFDLGRWFSAREEGRRSGQDDADSPFGLTALTQLAKGLFSDWRLDSRSGVREFTGAVHKLLKKEETHLLKGEPRDNRIVWSRVLYESDFGHLTTLPALIRIYLATMEGTCGIERNLGSLTRVLSAHVGPLDEDGHTAACLTQILLDGPADETGLATQALPDSDSASHALIPTEFTRNCAELWVAWHGRRFRRNSYATKPKKVRTTPPRLGTSASVARRTAKGMDSLADSSSGADSRTMLKLPRSFFAQEAGRSGPANPRWGVKLAKFHSFTQVKIARSAVLLQARRHTKARQQNPYTARELNPMLKLRKGKVFTKSVSPGYSSSSSGPSVVRVSGSLVKVVSLCGHLLDIKGYSQERLSTSSSATMWKQLSKADLIVLDSVWLDSQRPTEERVILAAVAFGLGKALLPKSAWKGAFPHKSPEVLHLLPATQTVERIALTTSLRSESARLCDIFQHLSNHPASKWKLVDVSAPMLKGKAIETLSSLSVARSFLLRVRRVWRERAGMSGKYFK
jgi:hypothetical protein